MCVCRDLFPLRTAGRWPRGGFAGQVEFYGFSVFGNYASHLRMAAGDSSLRNRKKKSCVFLGLLVYFAEWLGLRQRDCILISLPRYLA